MNFFEIIKNNRPLFIFTFYRYCWMFVLQNATAFSSFWSLIYDNFCDLFSIALTVTFNALISSFIG